MMKAFAFGNRNWTKVASQFYSAVQLMITILALIFLAMGSAK